MINPDLDVIKEINKKAKATKITTLRNAKSFQLKRMFSGSVFIDWITGGGFGYKRAHMIFGSKSCIDGDSFLMFESWYDGKRINSKGGTIRRLYERFTGDVSEGVKQGRHLQNTEATYYAKSVDDEGHVIRNEVLDVVKCGKKECYEVTVSNGDRLISTMKHKYLTPEGYKPLSDLKIGDVLYVHTNNRVKGRQTLPTRPSICVKYHPYFPPKIVKSTYKDKTTDYLYYRGQTSRIAYEAHLNGMSFDDYVEFLNKRSKKDILNLEFLPTDIHVHHKDENFLNNAIDNLELVDPSEHGKLHMQDRIGNLQIIVEEFPIVSIEFIGERETYDLKCAYPYNNYIANNIVVHNSGKNALLNQTIAYNQRMCRMCHGIMPDFYNLENDRHSMFLKWVMGYPVCKCDEPVQKKFLVLDYEKTLSLEQPSNIKVIEISDKKTGDRITEVEYQDNMDRIDFLSTVGEDTDDNKMELARLNNWIKTINIDYKEVEQLATLDYLVKCGIDTDSLLVADPEDTEEGTEIVREIIKSNSVDGIIWDSLQAAVPKYVKERSSEDATMGVEAKSNGLMLRHMCSAFAASDLTDEREAYKPAVFITSQIRSSLGGFIAKQDTFSGGHATAHMMSLILEVKKEEFIKEDGSKASFKDPYYGQKIRVRAEKNKLAPPGDMYEYNYYFKDTEHLKTGTIDHVAEIVSLGVVTGHIVRGGAYYTLSTGDKFQGMDTVVEKLRGDYEFLGKLYKAILDGR